MPKSNIKGGKKHKRGKKTSSDNSDSYPLATDGQLYALVIKKAGGHYIDVKCSDDKERKAFIRGALRKKVWMNSGDVLLISCREGLSEDNKCDIIYRYSYPQAKKLLSFGLIKFDIKANDEAETEDVMFEDEVTKFENEEFKESTFDKFAKEEKIKQRMGERNNKQDGSTLRIEGSDSENGSEKPFNFDDI